jgi:hypothetical protein
MLAPSVRLQVVVSAMAERIAPFLVGPSTQVKVPEIGGRLGGYASVEVDHSAVGSRVSSDHAMGIVASSTPDIGVVRVGVLSADGRQVVAFVAQGRPAGTESTSTPAERVLEQIELEKVRIQRSVRPARTGAPGRPGLVVVMGRCNRGWLKWSGDDSCCSCR